MRKHLIKHIKVWVSACDKLGIKIDAQNVNDEVAKYRAENDVPVPSGLGSQQLEAFSIDGLQVVLMDLVVIEDLVSHLRFTVIALLIVMQPLNFVESKRLVHLILYLRRDITADHILGRTTMKNLIIQTWYAHMHRLAQQFKVCVRVSAFALADWEY
jgi:hypothetical protein